jgi:hypothetical protein
MRLLAMAALGLAAVSLAICGRDAPARAASAEGLVVTRVAVVDFVTDTRADKEAPGMARRARGAAMSALDRFAPVARAMDVELAFVESGVRRKDIAKRAFGSAVATAEAAAVLQASHVVGGQIRLIGRNFVVELRVARAEEPEFVAKVRGKCETAAEVAETIDALVAELGITTPEKRDQGRDAWAARGGANERMYALRGGDDEIHRALRSGLDWLVRHQSDDGHWSTAKYSERCKDAAAPCSGAGQRFNDVGVTALALMALLADGNTPTAGPHADAVAKAVAYLVEQQQESGEVGPGTSLHSIYIHCAAAWALAEAYGMTRDPKLRPVVERSVAYTLGARNVEGAWRYGQRSGQSDTSVTAWAVASLRAAEMAGVPAKKIAFHYAVAWVDSMTEPEFGRVGYQRRAGPPARTVEMMELFPADQSESLTAAALAVRLFTGAQHDDEYVRKGRTLLLGCPPRWDLGGGAIDYYYWFWGSLVFSDVGGKQWGQWSGFVKAALIGGQRGGGACEHGSWPTSSPWSPDGGRVYTTAMACLTLAASQRYDVELGRVSVTR